MSLDHIQARITQFLPSFSFSLSDSVSFPMALVLCVLVDVVAFDGDLLTSMLLIVVVEAHFMLYLLTKMFLH